MAILSTSGTQAAFHVNLIAPEREAIVATLIDKEREVDFLVRQLGPDWLPFEHGVCQLLMQACRTYSWGLWDIYTLSNGGFYMAPTYTGCMRIQCYNKGFVGMLSPDAAGMYA